MDFFCSFDSALVGVLAQLSAPLKNAEIGIFVTSTWYVHNKILFLTMAHFDSRNTDYLLVNQSNIEQAVEALKADGWTFSSTSDSL